MRAVLVLLILTLQCGFSLAADSLTQLRNAMDYCAGQNVVALDDLVSPANVVAKALYTVCRQKHQDLYAQLAPSHSPSWFAGYERGAVDQFTVYVLSYRSMRSRLENKRP